METKLTVRVSKHLLENAKQFASKHQTTLTGLISAYLQNIPSQSKGLENAPTVRRMTGVLSQKASVEDYREHLEQKYGQ